MRISDFKKQTNHLPDETLIYTSYMTQEHALNNLESIDLIEGCLLASNFNSRQTVNLKTIRELKNESLTLEVDIEDGIVFQPVTEILIFDDKVLIL